LKTSKKDFEIFKVECRKWINILGLKDWQVHFTHTKMDGIRAQIVFQCIARVATISLNTEWNEWAKISITDQLIKKAAFHEVCELLMGKLNDLATQRFNLDEADVEEEIHRIIRTLENVLWEKSKK